MMQQRIGLASAPDRHHQSVGDELGRHRGAHRPANHPPREQIDHRRHIEPALRGPDIGEVCDPFAVRSRRFEAAIQHVRSNGGGLPLTQIGRQPTPARTRFEGLQPHQSLDPVQSARDAVGGKITPNPPGAVGAVAANKAGAHLGAEFIIAAAAPTARPCQPGIEAAPRDTERPAHPIRRPDPPVLRNEGELHVDSFAK
jgi:hypothetical protein